MHPLSVHHARSMSPSTTGPVRTLQEFVCQQLSQMLYQQSDALIWSSIPLLSSVAAARAPTTAFVTMSLTQTEVAHPLLSEGVIRLQNEIHDHINTHPSIEEKFKKGLQDASDKVMHDVRGLSKSICEIQGAFSGISKALHRFDDETDLGESDGSSSLGQRWDGLHEVSHISYLSCS